MNVSDILYVVCSSEFASPPYDGTALGLGLGLGLGIPFLCLCLCLAYRGYAHNYKYQHGKELSVVPDLARVTAFLQSVPTRTWTPKERVEYKLKSEVLSHLFATGQLTDELKKHIMMIRVREGRNLDEFTAYAKELGNRNVLEFCETLHPAMIPRNIQQEALQPADHV